MEGRLLEGCMFRSRAAAVLLLVAVCAPLGWAGSADAPELTDPAGDQAITRQLPGGVPALSDDDFDDIDITAAWFSEGVRHDACPNDLDCPAVALTIVTANAWRDGRLSASFRVERGPTSYATTTATGQTFTIDVQGLAVTGIPNATAVSVPEGLEITLGLPRLGAVGGDILANLTLATSRTNAGLLTDPAATQDDATGTDSAGPGQPYTVRRPPPAADVDVGIARTGNATGNAVIVTQRTSVPVQLRILNLGTDEDAYSIAVTSNPPLKNPPVLAAVQTPLLRGATAEPVIHISLQGMDAGTVRVTFTVTTTRGATDSAFANIILDLPAAASREVIPSGLEFLTPAAEAVRFDDAFNEFAEAALLALIVLLAILLIFLAVALAPSTLAGAGEPESPPLAATEEAPVAVLPAIAAVPVAAAMPESTDLKIESITHSPADPEEGAEISSEIVLRNPGATRHVRIVLAHDGADVDEKTVTLGARATKAIRLSWTAGPGENQVNVRVLPA